MSDDFYVGYFPQAPKNTARLVRISIAVITLVAIGAALLIAFAQRGFGNGTFEYGTIRDFQGTLFERPVPHLVTAGATYLLVDQFKHGAAEKIRGFDGVPAHVRGTLIQRDNSQMIELASAPGRSSTSPLLGREVHVLGPVERTGEIADSKCWLGVMNPGEGKVHRECAALCIRGGIPPLLLAGELRPILVSANDAPLNDVVADMAGQKVRVKGTLVRSGTLHFLRVDSITR